MVNVRRVLAHGEAAFWMSRMHANALTLWMVLIGWYAGADFGGGTAPVARLVGLCLFVAFLSSALQIVNDILDADGDAVTAPYLPLPAGLISRSAASWWSAGYLAIALLALSVSVPSVSWFFAILGMACAATLLIFLYSPLKAVGLVGSAPIALLGTLPLAWGWLVAGHRHGVLFVVLLCYGLANFLAGNIVAALRDVDLDGTVGNQTLPVQVGGPRAFRSATRAVVVAWLLVLVACLLAPNGPWGLALAVPGAVLLAVSYGPVLRTLDQPDRGRVQRMKDLAPVQLSERARHCALVAAIDPAAAILAAVALEAVVWGGGFLYSRRLISGRLVRPT